MRFSFLAYIVSALFTSCLAAGAIQYDPPSGVIEVCNQKSEAVVFVAINVDRNQFRGAAQEYLLYRYGWHTVEPKRCFKQEIYGGNTSFYYVHIETVKSGTNYPFSFKYDGYDYNWDEKAAWCVTNDITSTWPKYQHRDEALSLSIKCPAGTYKVIGYRVPKNDSHARPYGPSIYEARVTVR